MLPLALVSIIQGVQRFKTFECCSESWFGLFSFVEIIFFFFYFTKNEFLVQNRQWNININHRAVHGISQNL